MEREKKERIKRVKNSKRTRKLSGLAFIIFYFVSLISRSSIYNSNLLTVVQILSSVSPSQVRAKTRLNVRIVSVLSTSQRTM